MIEVVRMQQAHISQIAALESQNFSAPWSAESLNKEIQNELALWLVALDGHTVAGYIGSESVLGESDMMNVAVAEQFRRKGIGELLVRELIRQLKQQKNRQLTLEVRASNIPACNLYLKLGFVQVGKRPNYYRKPREDALILRKDWVL